MEEFQQKFSLRFIVCGNQEKPKQIWKKMEERVCESCKRVQETINK